MKDASCVTCRHCVALSERIRVSKPEEKPKFDVIDRWHCKYDNLTHTLVQRGCSNFVSENMTWLEYLMATQPQTVFNLLDKFGLRLKDAKNKFGFDVVGKES